jgi:hypothetical protein
LKGLAEFDEAAVPVWDDAHWLLGFVKDRHVPCPRCGYDLRNLTKPQCPECGEPLALKVGMDTPRFGLMVLAMAPGVFSGVAAVLLAFPLFRLRTSAPGKGPPTAMYVAEVFGVLSGLSTCGLYLLRKRYLGMSHRAQLVSAVGVWLVHILAFVLLVVVLSL